MAGRRPRISPLSARVFSYQQAPQNGPDFGYLPRSLVENVCDYLRKNRLALCVNDRYEDIVEACCDAWTEVIAIPACSHR